MYKILLQRVFFLCTTSAIYYEHFNVYNIIILEPNYD